MVLRVLALLALIIGGGCDLIPGERVLAVVEGRKVTEQDLTAFLTLQGIRSIKGMEGARKGVLSQLIEEMVVAMEAEREGLKVEEKEVDGLLSMVPEEERTGIDEGVLRRWARTELLAERMIDRVVRDVRVEEKELRSYYEAHKEDFRREGRVRALHIVVATEDEAREVLRRLEAGEDFGRVAREVSLSPDGKRGGDLGYFHPGDMPEEFEHALATLKKGELSPVVRSPYGYHILKLLDREGPSIPPFEEVRDGIATRLRMEKEGMVFRRWLESLKARSRIEINEEALKEVLG